VVHWTGSFDQERAVIDPVQVIWSPIGATMPSLGARPLVDVTDGDTTNLRMPVRMLSVDTPEVTAHTPARAAAVDREFVQLAEWIRAGQAPISRRLADFIVPRLATGTAGTLQFQQGRAASAFTKQNIETRLQRPDGTRRNIFIRIADTPFDDNNRLLAYLAPNYGDAERRQIPRHERTTFNLDLVTSGWGVSFVIYPAIPGALDLPLLIRAAATARTSGIGVWADPHSLLGYEYRAMERLYRLTKKLVTTGQLDPGEAYTWRERYCIDMRNRVLHGPEDYVNVEPEYRLWIRPRDLNDAVARLNLVPAPALVGAA
jgi:endonuclease YncB( thermonuclease family)